MEDDDKRLLTIQQLFLLAIGWLGASTPSYRQGPPGPLVHVVLAGPLRILFMVPLPTILPRCRSSAAAVARARPKPQRLLMVFALSLWLLLVTLLSTFITLLLPLFLSKLSLISGVVFNQRLGQALVLHTPHLHRPLCRRAQGRPQVLIPSSRCGFSWCQI